MNVLEQRAELGDIEAPAATPLNALPPGRPHFFYFQEGRIVAGVLQARLGRLTTERRRTGSSPLALHTIL
jgi:hypothetical protein